MLAMDMKSYAVGTDVAPAYGGLLAFGGWENNQRYVRCKRRVRQCALARTR